jgi:hypothetical protein
MNNEGKLEYIATAIATRIAIMRISDQSQTIKWYIKKALEQVQKEDNVILSVKNKSGKGVCPECGHVIEQREISLYKGLFEALAKVYSWCVDKNIHEFTMKDIRGMIGHNEYARFGDWVFFSGLVYKQGKARYGLNMERCGEFLRGDKEIVIAGWKDPITRQFTPSRYGKRHDIPGLEHFLDSNGLFDARYTGAPIKMKL